MISRPVMVAPGLALVLLLTFPEARAEPASEMASIEEFSTSVRAGADDPREIARLAVLGLVVFQRDEERARQMFSLLVEDDDRAPDPESPTGFRVVRSVADDLARTRGRPHIAAGYCGGTPGAGYADADLAGCPVRFDSVYSSTRQGIGYPKEGRAKFFVANGGASSPRPVTLIRVDGGWRLRIWGSLLTGVADPVE